MYYSATTARDGRRRQMVAERRSRTCDHHPLRLSHPTGRRTKDLLRTGKRHCHELLRRVRTGNLEQHRWRYGNTAGCERANSGQLLVLVVGTQHLGPPNAYQPAECTQPQIPGSGTIVSSASAARLDSSAAIRSGLIALATYRFPYYSRQQWRRLRPAYLHPGDRASCAVLGTRVFLKVLRLGRWDCLTGVKDVLPVDSGLDSSVDLDSGFVELVLKVKRLDAADSVLPCH